MEAIFKSKKFITCLSIMIVYAIGSMFSPRSPYGFFGSIIIIIAGTFFTTVGALLGEKFRDFAAPDVIVAKDTGDMINKKIFWKIGPQCIGWFIGFLATNGLLSSIYGR